MTQLIDIESEVVRYLHEGKVRFTFKKKDRTIRQANGTLSMKRIPASNHPKGTGFVSHKVVPYFDLDKMEWRCFSKGSVIEFLEVIY